MRIALLSTFHQQCGIATYAENLVEALRSRGGDVLVFAPKLRRSDRTTDGEQPPRLWNANLAFGIEAFRVVRSIERAGCTVVHANVNLSLFSSRFLFTLATLLRRRNIPLVATLHGRDGGSIGRRFKVWRFTKALRSAQLIVHSESHADELRQAGHPAVHVVPHGLPPIERKPLQEARRELGLDPARPIIAHFGFMVPDKGVLEMVRAVAALRAQRHRDLFYWISGAVYRTSESRAYFESVQAEVERLGLASHVRLTGEFVTHEQALLAMQAADWVVLNYRTGNAQGASGAVTRALASGRPVAVSEAPVFDDVRHATHTLRGELVAAVSQILEDRSLLERTIARADAYFEIASWPRVADAHLALYQQLAPARGALHA